MTKEAQRLIASMGGTAVVKKKGKAFMRQIGAIGGATRHKNYLDLMKQRCERHEP